MNQTDLIYDWNSAGGDAFDWSAVSGVELDDETLREGLQDPSVVDPSIDAKIRLLHLMDALGIHTADIGLPGAGPPALAAEIVEAGLSVMFVTEDTVRARPGTLRALYGQAIGWGARRLCLADTVGHATPHGVRTLVRFVIEEIVKPSGEDLGVDWHGHRDRGLGLANALAAIESGATRVSRNSPRNRGAGGQCGNGLLLVNLKLLGLHDADLALLSKDCHTAAKACRVPPVRRIPRGRYLASMVGRAQEVEVSPMSGFSNVRAWLAAHGYDPDDDTACRILLDAAKSADRTLTETEIVALLGEGSGQG